MTTAETRATTLPATTARRSRSWRRRAWPALLVPLLAAAVAALVLDSTLFAPRFAAAQVRRAELVRTVVASGRVQTPYRAEIGSQVTGVVTQVLVDRGDRVVRDEVLVRLEDAEARAVVAQAEAAVAQAEARLRQITEVTNPVAEEALRQAQATLVNARRAYERAAQLQAGGFAPQSVLDEARKALDIAEAQHRSARLQAEGTRPGGIERTLAETVLRQARANLDAARARLRYTAIRAPADGTIIGREANPGDVVQPGRALLVLSPAGGVEIVIQLDERNLALVALGQPALASADAWPDRRFAAEVSFINPAVDRLRGSVEVKLRVPDPPDYLRQDMTVSVDIEVGRRAGALVLPLAAVNDLAGERPWVLRVGTDGRAERREVRIGLRDTERAEVLEGLAEGDLVLLAAGGQRAPAEGRRVRAVVR